MVLIQNGGHNYDEFEQNTPVQNRNKIKFHVFVSKFVTLGLHGEKRSQFLRILVEKTANAVSAFSIILTYILIISDPEPRNKCIKKRSQFLRIPPAQEFSRPKGLSTSSSPT